MLHLCYANRLDVLTAPLGAHVGEAQRADPLAPVTIVVPNRSIAQFVRFRLAEQLGVAANLRFDFLERCLRRAVTEADPLLRVLDPAALRVLLYGRLRDPHFVAAPALGPVRAWLGAMPEADPEARALELAGQLAGLFDGYARARQGMLRAWAKGPVCGPDFADAEGWQRALYRAVFDDRGVARVRGVATTPGTDQLSLFGPPTRWMLLADAIARAEKLALPPALHVFGLSYVPPAFAEALRRVAGETALYVYALNPCLEFWEDVDAGFGAQRELDARRRAWARRGAGGDREGADPYDLDRPGDTPALRLWGRPGREYVRLLGDLSGSTFAPGFVDPVQGAPTLLSRLQRDVLLRAPERPPVADGGAPDDSITFVACPGLRREVEIVADRVWALMTEDAPKGSKPLRFHEIGVLVTDARRDAYLTHIEAVFRARHDLPFNMVDRRLAGQSRVVEAVERLLDLPGEAPGYTALVDLITHPAVAGADGDTWRGWLEALGVVLAPDREALAGTYVDRDVFTWDQVVRRLALGAVTGDVDAPLVTEAGAWLPFAVQPEQVGSVGRLAARLRALLEDAAAFGAARLTLSTWAEALSTLVSTHLGADTAHDEAALARCLAVIGRLGEADVEGAPVPFAVARSLTREGIARLDAGRGQHLADGVVVSSLLPMRAVPFRAVFVLGLGEGEFPAREREDPLDLRRARRVPGDVSPAERDRYLFLETLLAARERVVLSWVARDAKTGDALEPSPVVRELQFVLRGYVGADGLAAMTVRHPVVPYDDAHFPEFAPAGATTVGPPLPPVTGPARRAAQVRALRRDLERHLGGPMPPEHAVRRHLAPDVYAQVRAALRVEAAPDAEAARDEPLTLSVAALLNFLRSPLQGSARAVLGLAGVDEAADVPTDEPLTLDARDRRALLDEAFRAGGGDRAATHAAWRAGFERLTLAGRAPVGPFAARRAAEDLAVLDAWLDHVERDGEGPWTRLRLGGDPRAEAPADEVLPALNLTARVDGAPRQVLLSGTLQPVRGATTLRCVTREAPDATDDLPAFVTRVILAALERAPDERCTALIATADPAGAGRVRRPLRVPPPDFARAWLANVAGELLTGLHPYRMPIEALLRWRRALHYDAGAAFSVRPSERTSDDHGPIRDPAAFPVAPTPYAHAAMTRRLGDWFHAGGG